jgi:hypothetical protein
MSEPTGAKRKPGPAAGSDAARRNGFGADRERASRAGKTGGTRVREQYGAEHFRQVGTIGGRSLARQRGSLYMTQIGRQGAAKRWGSRRASGGTLTSLHAAGPAALQVEESSGASETALPHCAAPGTNAPSRPHAVDPRD